MWHGFGEKRQLVADFRRTLDHGVRAECADAHSAIGGLDTGKPGKPGDVDQELRRRQPHVERRNEALPAREDFRARALEKLQRFRQRARFRVGERRRLQIATPPLLADYRFLPTCSLPRIANSWYAPAPGRPWADI